MRVNGTLINYYFHCKRQCYLHGNRLNLEDNSEQVQIGKEFVLDEQEGVESVVYPDDTAPYYAGEMIGTFHIRPIQREVDFFGKENRRFGGNV